MSLNITLHPMDERQYKKYSEISFSDYIQYVARTSGESLASVQLRIGGPPDCPGDDDLWFVIKSETTEIGYIWVKVNYKTKEAFGYDIHLDPNFRGQGIGRYVMLEGRKILRQIQIEKLKICVFSDNLPARSLYSSLGFKEVESNPIKKQHTLEIEV